MKKTYFLLISLLLLTTATWGQSVYLLHPLVGEEIDGNERRRYRLDPIFGLHLPTWHRLSIDSLDQDNFVIYSLEEKNDSLWKVDSDQVREARQAILQKGKGLLAQLGSLEKALDQKDTVFVRLKLEHYPAFNAKAVGLTPEVIQMGEEDHSLIDLPLEKIRAMRLIHPPGVPNPYYDTTYLQRDRLFATSTAIPLHRGEFYYQNIYLLGHRFRVGLTEEWSLTAGMDLITHLGSLGSGYYYGLTNFALNWGRQVGKKWHIGAEAQTFFMGFDGGLYGLSGLATYGTEKANTTFRLSAAFANNYVMDYGINYAGGVGLNVQLGRKVALVSENLLRYYKNGDYWGRFDGSLNEVENYGLLTSLGFRYIWGKNSVDIGFFGIYDYKYSSFSFPNSNGVVVEEVFQRQGWNGFFPYISLSQWFRPR